MVISCFGGGASGEEGFFAESLCREINMENLVEWSEGAMLFYDNLPDEAKAVIDGAEKVGDIYEYASVTFYSNGSMKQRYKIKDEIYKAFANSELFASIIPQELESESGYQVDKKAGIITLDDGSTLTVDVTAVAFTKELIVKECYMIPGQVEGESNGIVKKFTMMENISYGTDERNTMDIFVPDNLDPAKENGAFIIIYGGSWTSGNKEDNRKLAQQYAEAGYMAVAINMRNSFYDEAAGKTVTSIYDMLNDVQASVKKLKAMSDEKGWNVTQCATKGFSSGANIAMLYAYSRGSGVPWFDTEEILPVRFVANVVGPADMHDSAWHEDPDWPEADKFLTAATPGIGPLYAMLITGAVNKGELTEEELEECINSMSPLWYVDQFGGLPTVMGYSARDIMQSPNNGKRLKDHLDAKGVRNHLYTFTNPASIHSYAGDPELAQEYFEKTLEYAETYFVSRADTPEDPSKPEVPSKPVEDPNPGDNGTESGKKVYHILKGADGLWTVEADGSVSICADGDLADFVSLKVDGKLVDTANYTLKAGSTIVTLLPGYLKALGKGDHTVTFVYKDGEASMVLPLDEDGKPVKLSSPKTGDTQDMAVWFAVLLGSALCIELMRRKRFLQR